MTAIEIGDFVWVMFPFVEEARLVRRPGLVISDPLGPDRSLRWLLMVTNAQRAGWHGDIAIEHWESLGLVIPSKVRTQKVATVDIATAERIGPAGDKLLAAVMAEVRGRLA